MPYVSLPVLYFATTLLQRGLVYLTWDVGHDAKAGYSDSKFIKAHSSSLRHMHLHDVDDKSDHQILFSGKVDIHQRIEIARDNDLNIVVEVKTIEALRESVRRLKEHGYFPFLLVGYNMTIAVIYCIYGLTYSYTISRRDDRSDA